MRVEIERYMNACRKDREYKVIISADVTPDHTGQFSLDDYGVDIYLDERQLKTWRYDVVYYHIKERLIKYDDYLIEGAGEPIERDDDDR